MTQIDNTTSSSQSFHNQNIDTYTYQERKVKIITVFKEGTTATALVEDENGELFEVARDLLI